MRGVKEAKFDCEAPRTFLKRASGATHDTRARRIVSNGRRAADVPALPRRFAARTFDGRSAHRFHGGAQRAPAAPTPKLTRREKREGRRASGPRPREQTSSNVEQP